MNADQIVDQLGRTWRRLWPLCWLSTADDERRAQVQATKQAKNAEARRHKAVAASNRVRDETNRAVKKASTEVEEAKNVAASFQARFEDVLRQRFPVEIPWDVLERVSEIRPIAQIKMPPTFTWTGLNPCARGEFVPGRAVKFGVQVVLQLGGDTPPELVARHVADEVRMAVLVEWQRQSVLGGRR